MVFNDLVSTWILCFKYSKCESDIVCKLEWILCFKDSKLESVQYSAALAVTGTWWDTSR